jgi:hypothetical protein
VKCRLQNVLHATAYRARGAIAEIPAKFAETAPKIQTLIVGWTRDRQLIESPVDEDVSFLNRSTEYVMTMLVHITSLRHALGQSLASLDFPSFLDRREAGPTVGAMSRESRDYLCENHLV